MQSVKLPQERLKQLYAFCRTATADEAEIIDLALDKALGCDMLRVYILRHVVLGWGWARLQAEGIPCGRDTFRYYRAKFFAALNSMISSQGKGCGCYAGKTAPRQ